MALLQGNEGTRDVLRRLRATGRGVLLLDFDGTLAPFTADPASTRPYPGVPAALDALIQQGATRIVVVTGRSVADGLPQLPTSLPLELWGGHGRERRLPDGTYRIQPLEETALRALLAADEWAGEVEALGGRTERKPGSLAFHWRGLPEDQVPAIRRLVLYRYASLPAYGGLRWLDFDGGIELSAPGPSKADAVTTLQAESGAEVPMAFLGDDRTDEDAFVAIRDRGLGILVRREFRPTAAGAWLRPPAELLDFLTGWYASLEPAR